MVDHKLASRSDLELMIGKDEKILWKGRPNKKCFILEGIFNPMLPFALVWFFFLYKSAMSLKLFGCSIRFFI